MAAIRFILHWLRWLFWPRDCYICLDAMEGCGDNYNVLLGDDGCYRFTCRRCWRRVSWDEGGTDDENCATCWCEDHHCLPETA